MDLTLEYHELPKEIPRYDYECCEDEHGRRADI